MKDKDYENIFEDIVNTLSLKNDDNNYVQFITILMRFLSDVVISSTSETKIFNIDYDEYLSEIKNLSK